MFPLASNTSFDDSTCLVSDYDGHTNYRGTDADVDVKTETAEPSRGPTMRKRVMVVVVSFNKCFYPHREA